jgi:hypothetical protein
MRVSDIRIFVPFIGNCRHRSVIDPEQGKSNPMGDDDPDRFPHFDPDTVHALSQYSALSAPDFARELVDSFNGRVRDPPVIIPQLARCIAGFNLLIEDASYEVESEIRDPSVTISTLPHHSGDDNERISTVQPTAWLLDGPGSYYDPNEQRIQMNLVGYWNGVSHSLKGHLWRSLTNGCFMAYHLIVVLSFVLMGLMFLQDERSFEIEHPSIRRLSLALPPVVAVLYDVLAMLFVVISVIHFPERGNPREADRVQSWMTARLSGLLRHVYDAIPQEELGLIIAERHPSVEEVVGTFILRYFYEPAVTALSAALRPTSGFYKVDRATELSWTQFEDLLTLYRFVREISDSAHLGTTHIKFDGRHVSHLTKLVVSAIQNGVPEVHFQLCRLLFNATAPSDVRAAKVRADHMNLSLNHYVGNAEVEQVVSRVKQDIKRARLAGKAEDPTANQRRANIGTALNAAPSVVSSAARTPQPSRFG